MMKFLRILVLSLLCVHPSLWGADSTRTILFISDTQQPLWIETLRVPSSDNEAATRQLYSAISHDTSAEALFHLGDITAVGMFDAYWQPFDAFQRVLRIPVYPVLGNHDHYVFPVLSMRQFKARFPAFTSSWYATVIGSAAVIALNSNFSHLSDDERRTQQLWYRQTLSLYNRDSTVKTIIVICHHSPFTNSAIIDPSTEVQNEFVEPFMRTDKCRVFLSGHAHTYEHFRRQGKEFLVIGGGGGLLHALRSGPGELFHDEYPDPVSPRFFHYLECRVLPSSLLFQVHKLRKDLSGFDIVDPFTVQFDR